MARIKITPGPPAPEKILLYLNDMRKEGKYCDVVINIGVRKFSCHRGILAGYIPYFAAMFGGNFEGSNESEKTLKDIDEDGFDHLLNYLYTGRIEINSNTVKKILSVAQFLMMEYPLNKCIRFIIKNIDTSNVMDYHFLAHNLGLDNLKKHTFEYIETYFSELAGSQQFLEIPYNILEEFLRSDHISVTNEDYIIKIVEDWILHNFENRKNNVHDLLKNVRFNLISAGGFIFSKLYKKLILDSVDIIRDVSTCSCLSLTQRTRRKHVLIFGNQKKGNCKRILALRYNGDVIREVNDLSQTTYYKNLQSTVLKDRIFLSAVESNSSRSFKYFNNQDKIWCPVSVVDNNNRVVNMISLDILNTIYINVERPLLDLHGQRFTSIYCYNADIDKWNAVCDSLDTSYNAALISYKNIFYSCGASSNGNLYTVTSLALFDPRFGWNRLRNLPISCYFSAGTILNDMLYITGGRSEDSKHYQCFMYDIRADNWIGLQSMSRPRHSHSLLPFNNKLYAIGGDCPVVEMYDPKLNTWQDGIRINYFIANKMVSILF